MKNVLQYNVWFRCSVALLTMLFGVLSTSCNSSQRANRSDLQSEIAIAKTEQGEVIGSVDQGVYVFKGIPYATAQRFMAPQPAPTRQEPLSCTEYGDVPPQVVYERDESQTTFYSIAEGEQSEDCLNLNIWTPEVQTGPKNPVLVYLFTGHTIGHTHELAGYDGAKMAREHNVVVVTPNHRLNVLGYLDLSFMGQKYKDSPNAGLLDVVAALEWVKQNIHNFGGDPNNITIMGQGTGGGKVLALMSMPMANGLFHKAIIESGSLFKVMDNRYARRIASFTLEELGINSNNIDQIDTINYSRLHEAGNKALERVRVIAIEEGHSPALAEDDNLAQFFGWAPTIDGVVLTEHPYIIARNSMLNVPLLIGSNLHEAPYTYYNEEIKRLDDSGRDSLAITTLGPFYQAIEEQFRSTYPHIKYAPRELLDIDIDFRRMALNIASQRYGNGAAPIYMYHFGYETPVQDGVFRSHHAMEVPFALGNVEEAASMTGGGENAHELSQRMSASWAAFIHNGDPRSPSLPVWPEWSPTEGATMLLGQGTRPNCSVVYKHDSTLIELLSRANNPMISKANQ